ncbi:MAG TPA: vitamin K epoxide reductase family protein [Baekduia sp.]|nr:vitamin K epoxide reductase family protein [Baekduia sp.]
MRRWTGRDTPADEQRDDDARFRRDGAPGHPTTEEVARAARTAAAGVAEGDEAWAIPPGWSHNPTSYRRRLLLSGLSFTGLLIAIYLVLYQFRLYPESAIVGPWDSPKVLDATYPVPDAFAGVIAYGAELLLLALGGRDRWRSLPWVCLSLGAILATGAVVSVALIVVQPTVVGHWCIWCLGSALISFLLFFLGFGEAIASWQHVRRARERGVALGDAVWGRAAWVSTAQEEPETRSPAS